MDFQVRVVNPSELGPCESCGKDAAFKFCYQGKDSLEIAHKLGASLRFCYQCSKDYALSIARLMDGSRATVHFSL